MSKDVTLKYIHSRISHFYVFLYDMCKSRRGIKKGIEINIACIIRNDQVISKKKFEPNKHTL